MPGENRLNFPADERPPDVHQLENAIETLVNIIYLIEVEPGQSHTTRFYTSLTDAPVETICRVLIEMRRQQSLSTGHASA